MKTETTEALYESLFNNMPDGLAHCQMVFGVDGNPSDIIYLQVNKSFEKLMRLEGVINKKITELAPGIKESNPEMFEIYGRVSLTQKPERFEMYDKDVSKWFLVSVFSPKKTFFVAIFQNITDRKQVEKNLENSKTAARNVLEDLNIEKERLEMARAKEEAILFSIGDGIIATDERGHITLINKVAEKLLGKKSKEVMGKDFFISINMEDAKGNPIAVNERPTNIALATGTVVSWSTHYYVRSDKTKFPVATVVTPIMFNEKVVGVIEVFRDITQEKQVDKAKSEFVSLASHQLRAPLTAVSWYVEMILRGDVGEVLPKQKKYLEEVYGGNRRMIDLVNTLLDVSSIELGTIKVDPKPTDVIALAENVILELRLMVEQGNLNITKDFEKNLPKLSIDPKILGMIFQNLLTNAVQYTPSGGEIKFTISASPVAKQEEWGVLIKVSDTGYGIPKNQQSQIFAKLFRADNVREKDTKGTGLGLYMVKSMVENLGGKIWFESPNPTRAESDKNPGTNFNVTLPLKR